MPDLPIHSHFNLKYALEGRIVTMDRDATILDRGRLFIENGIIVDIQPVGGGYPPGFDSSDIIKSGGTIYPGMIELHNHLPYNILPYWVADRQYTNHQQWKTVKGYRVNVTGPMQTLGKTPGFPEAIVRYVECKSLIGGVTTSQGITLANSTLTRKVFHGIIRNVEETNESVLPEAVTRIADVGPGQAQAFNASLTPAKTRLLHLSEGIDDRARSFFSNLQIDADHWAISPKLNGIHCTALNREDFEILGRHGGSMTWSPMSNLVLYGATADIRAAKENNILIALGSDWSPSGSKNLLEELKVAYLVSQDHGDTPLFTNEELVRMTTSNPAEILGWEGVLGSLKAGAKADMLIVNGYQDEPYMKLIGASEKSLLAVFINGVPRCAQSRIFKKFNFDAHEIETFLIGNSERNLYLKETHQDDALPPISLKDATDTIAGGLIHISQLAAELEEAHGGGMLSASDNPFQMDWFLVPDFHADINLNELEEGHLEWGAGISFSEVAEPLPLDKLTVIGDTEHFRRMAQHPIPDFIRKNLPAFYGYPAIVLDSSSYEVENSRLNDFKDLMTLETFLKTSSNLSVDDKLCILKQAQIILDEIYVHKILKRSMYAVNPGDRIDLMIRDIRFNVINNVDYREDRNFHKELLSVFSSLRDLHTRYILPYPFKNRFAFLPFLIEEYYATQQDSDPRYIITTVFSEIFKEQSKIRAGLEVLYWNNIPITRAIELNSANQSGSNREARMARGLDTLTIRSLSTSIPPDEYKVTITCRDQDTGENMLLDFEWLVSFYPPYFDKAGDKLNATMIAMGFDYDTLSVNQMKANLYSDISTKSKIKKKSAWLRPLHFPKSMKGKLVADPGTGFQAAYIRIYSFSVASAENFVSDFKQMLQQLESDGAKALILDIRGNGGGLITASELLLALLVGRKVEFQKAQFINSELTLRLCEKYDADNDFLDLSPWTRSIGLSKRTGDYYSRGYPITSLSNRKKLKAIFARPMVLITDALCYSASDMFAAGFQDHKLGMVIGTHTNTGAGGANVWTHETLRKLIIGASVAYTSLEQLPKGANFNFAVRRILRKNDEPIEDLGIAPDVFHKITRKDLLEGNADLIGKALGILRGLVLPE